MYSDDTSMTLALMDSLKKCKKISLTNQLTKYVEWYNKGKYSCTGYCFGMGSTTRKAIQHYINEKRIRDNSEEFNECGNGSLMRTAPIVWWNIKKSKNKCLDDCELCSTTTHSHVICKRICRFFGSILYDIIKGEQNKEKLIQSLKYDQCLYPTLYTSEEFKNLSELMKVIECNYKEFNPINLYEENKQLTGYAPVTLMCALWAFLTTDNFVDGMIKAINIPGDCDTIGSVYGQIAGAYYDENLIKNEWFNKLKDQGFLYESILSFSNTIR